jgi:hypothetical protein
MAMFEQTQSNSQPPAPSGDEIAYNAGRKAALIEASENLSKKAGPSFQFGAPFVAVERGRIFGLLFL